MQITGVSLPEFERITRMVSASYGDNLAVHPDAHALSPTGTRIRARVYVLNSRGAGARRSWSGRHMPAACWHAYRDVLTELFNLYPHAIVRTSLAIYRGRDGFHATYPQTGNANVGSQMCPVTMPELCGCSGEERYVRPASSNSIAGASEAIQQHNLRVSPDAMTWKPGDPTL